MTGIGLQNLLFSVSFDPGNGTVERSGNVVSAAEETEQLLPPAADFATLLASLSNENFDFSKVALKPDFEAVQGLGHAQAFVAELLGREVELTPIGSAEGFELFRLTYAELDGVRNAAEKTVSASPDVEVSSLLHEVLSRSVQVEPSGVPAPEDLPGKAVLAIGNAPVRYSRNGEDLENEASDRMALVYLFYFQPPASTETEEFGAGPFSVARPVDESGTTTETEFPNLDLGPGIHVFVIGSEIAAIDRELEIDGKPGVPPENSVNAEPPELTGNPVPTGRIGTVEDETFMPVVDSKEDENPPETAIRGSADEKTSPNAPIQEDRSLPEEAEKESIRPVRTSSGNDLGSRSSTLFEEAPAGENRSHRQPVASRFGSMRNDPPEAVRVSVPATVLEKMGVPVKEDESNPTQEQTEAPLRTPLQRPERSMVSEPTLMADDRVPPGTTVSSKPQSGEGTRKRIREVGLLSSRSKLPGTPQTPIEFPTRGSVESPKTDVSNPRVRIRFLTGKIAEQLENLSGKILGSRVEKIPVVSKLPPPGQPRSLEGIEWIARNPKPLREPLSSKIPTFLDRTRSDRPQELEGATARQGSSLPKFERPSSHVEVPSPRNENRTAVSITETLAAVEKPRSTPKPKTDSHEPGPVTVAKESIEPAPQTETASPKPRLSAHLFTPSPAHANPSRFSSLVSEKSDKEQRTNPSASSEQAFQKPSAEPAPSLPAKTSPVVREENPVVRQIAQRLGSGIKPGAEMKIRLVPEHLGEIHVKISVREGRIVAEIRASSETTREMLTKNAATLQHLLSQSGKGVENVIVRTGTIGTDSPLTQHSRDSSQQHTHEEEGREPSKEQQSGGHPGSEEESRKHPRRHWAWGRFLDV